MQGIYRVYILSTITKKMGHSYLCISRTLATSYDMVPLSNSVHAGSQGTRNPLGAMSETIRREDKAERRSATQLRENFRGLLPSPESITRTIIGG